MSCKVVVDRCHEHCHCGIDIFVRDSSNIEGKDIVSLGSSAVTAPGKDGAVFAIIVVEVLVIRSTIRNESCRISCCILCTPNGRRNFCHVSDAESVCKSSDRLRFGTERLSFRGNPIPSSTSQQQARTFVSSAVKIVHEQIKTVPQISKHRNSESAVVKKAGPCNHNVPGECELF